MTGAFYLSGLWPPMRAAVEYLADFLGGYSIELRVVSGYRSTAEQAALYAQGRTPEEVRNRVKKFGSGSAVTDAPPGYSAHNYGLAIDIDSDDPNHKIVMDVAKAIGFGVVSWDPDHLEWPEWRRLVGI